MEVFSFCMDSILSHFTHLSKHNMSVFCSCAHRGEQQAVVACSDWTPRGKPTAKPETISGLRESDMAKAAEVVTVTTSKAGASVIELQIDRPNSGPRK